MEKLNDMIQNFWENQKEKDRKALEDWNKKFNKKVDVLVDNTSFDEKPQGGEIGGITNRLPQNKETVTLKELAQAAVNGQSWKASVLTDKSNASFVSSSIVALDIDNKKSYTSINDFLAIESKYQPYFIYETFSSTPEHERYRVVFVFEEAITSYNAMVALYKEVKAQYPTVDIDESVDPGKILFGGKALRYYNIAVNANPVLIVDALKQQKASTTAKTSKTIVEPVSVDFLTIAENIKNIADNYSDVEYVDINEAYEWINRNIKMTDILGIEEGVRFRCILDDHEDQHPSARIVTYGDEQAYMCSCEASGYRLISLLSKILEKSEIDTMNMLFENLGISFGSAYQRMCERYLAELSRHLDRELKQNLVDYLKRRKLYRTYELIIDFANKHIVCESLGVDSDKIVFFLSKRDLKSRMEERNISGATNSNAKLNALCELGLLRKLTDSEIKQNVLNIANGNRKSLQIRFAKTTGKDINVNRVDFYELVKLAPSVRKSIESRIAYMADNAMRQKGNNVVRRVNTFGAEEVTHNINVQSTIDTNKQDKVRTKLEAIIQDLLESRGYFNEEDVRKAYCAKDHHIKKADAATAVLDFIPVFMSKGQIERIRVNKSTRAAHNITGNYSSGSYVYVAKDNKKCIA